MCQGGHRGQAEAERVDSSGEEAPPGQLWFRVLGQVEVEAGGRLLDVGPRQRRLVLAALAIDAGKPVTLGTLAGRVWGSAAPDAPSSALYAHLTRLRRVLAQAAADSATPVALSRHGGGYVLGVDPQQIDVHRFRSLVEASRSVERAADRMTLLRTALSLWNGPPLPMFTGEWALRLRASLESQFISAITAWAAEELRHGNPGPVADRLAQAVAAHPLAEPLVALLMRALCGLGRTAEALAWYAGARRRVADELGAEPGLELRRLHVAILRGELEQAAESWGPCPPPARAAPPVTAAAGLGLLSAGSESLTAGSGSLSGGLGLPAAVAVPRQLPADLSRFTGRDGELAKLDQWATSDRSAWPVVLAVHGAAGTGKSALAVHLAHRLARQFQDGQLYLDLRGSDPVTPLDPAEGLARVLRACGVPSAAIPADLDEAAVLFRSVVAGRRLLILLDNAVTAAQVRPLLPGDRGCVTLVTSRAPLVGLGDVAHLRLGPLPAAESLRLLGRWVGEHRTAADPQAAAAIVRVCEGLPVALHAAAARLLARPGWSLPELARRLADPARRLDNMEYGGTGVRASLGSSLRRLQDGADPAERAAAEAFAVLGAACDGGFDLAFAARVLDRSTVDAERLLEHLIDAQLLEGTGVGGYLMAELPRAYARERAAAPPRWLADALPAEPRPRQAASN